MDIQSVVVTATRSGHLVRDEPVHVEVVPEEEIEENLTISPGTLTTLLNELAGARIQSSAPGLGGATLQLRGMPGRHTQVLSDGLPLSGGQTDAFSLLQSPPLDLARVEVIKGVSSALYGGTGLAGVLNLVSRAPGSESELLLNHSSYDANDAVAFLSAPPTPTWGFTAIGGAHLQARKDVDDDGWADIPGLTRFTLRPRLSWHGAGDSSLLATAAVVNEDRDGGSVPFPEALHTHHMDAGAIGSFPLTDGRLFATRASISHTVRDRTYGDARTQDTQRVGLIEATLGGADHGHAWIFGAAVQNERLDTADVPGVSYEYTVPGVFAQDEFSPVKWLVLAASARVDSSSDFGTFVSPRLSALIRTGDDWSVRASVGTGFAAPTPLVDEIESRGLSVLAPLGTLQAERAASASLDGSWRRSGWDINVSVFASETRDPLMAQDANDGVHLELLNSDTPRRVRGAEVLVGYVAGSLHMLASSTYLNATEAAPGENRHEADRIPRFTAELAGILEDEDRGRVGLELSYTGSQALTDNPYRTTSKPFLEINALAELRIGESSIFLNAINLTDVRQSDYDPLLRPTPGPAGDPIVNVWAPLQGLTINLGIRVDL